MKKNSLANLPRYSTKNFTEKSRSPANAIKPYTDISNTNKKTINITPTSSLSSKQLDNEKGKGIIIRHFKKLQDKATRNNGGLSSADDNLSGKKRKSLVNSRDTGFVKSFKK